MIYATPYNPTTKKCTGPSTDSGLESLDQVAEFMGPPTRRSRRWLAYVTDDDQAIAYSDFVFNSGETE
jgi:hypothetical protein